MADLGDAFGQVDPAHRPARRRGLAPATVIGRQQRVFGQRMQDVGQQQLLVLLLMLQAELDQRRDLGRGLGQQPRHRGIDMGAIGADRGAVGPRQHPPLRPGMPRPRRLVVGVEQEGVVFVQPAIARLVGQQHEGLEEPGGMRAVPLGRAGIRHGLDALVLGRERRGQRLGPRPGRGIARRERAGRPPVDEGHASRLSCRNGWPSLAQSRPFRIDRSGRTATGCANEALRQGFPRGYGAGVAHQSRQAKRSAAPSATPKRGASTSGEAATRPRSPARNAASPARSAAAASARAT